LVQLNDSEDRFTWNLTESGVFSVKSMYNDLVSGHTVSLKKTYLKVEGASKNKDFYVVPSQEDYSYKR
jgi:hypothetical protein